MRIGLIIAAGGTGTRIGSPVPKQFLHLGGRPILVRTVESTLGLPDLQQIVIALPADHIGRARAVLSERAWPVPIDCVAGGETRQDSVRRGLESLPDSIDLILVHDAVRPLCDAETMCRVAEAAWKDGGAVPGIPATDTIQRVSKRGRILATPPREQLHVIQTPQGFRAEVIRSAFERARAEGYLGTDESSVVRWAGHKVTMVSGAAENIKITRPVDLEIAGLLLSKKTLMKDDLRLQRVGQGIDYHRLVPGRKLVLGGVEIPFERGLEGHSDADVLMHAIGDALLGAAGLGDLGGHFSDQDPEHRDRSSLEFLAIIGEKLRETGWIVRNIDATILAQRPRLAGYIGSMRARIAGGLQLDPEVVNVKATTTEGMNAEGREEGISAQAVVLIESAPRES